MATWEPISDKHKAGGLIVAMHEQDPKDAVCVRWNGYLWVGAHIENFGIVVHSDRDFAAEFTHAYAVPDLTPRPA